MDYFLKDNKAPELTIGMPVFNEGEHVAEAIESLLAQTYKNFVLIISDNASTDNTPQICKYYAEKDKRIVYIRHAENKGSMFNFRYLVEQAKTPLFMWCSGNDKWHSSFIEKLLPAFKDEGVVLSYSEAEMLNDDGTSSGIYKYDYTTTGMDKAADRYLYFLWHYRARISNVWYGIWRTGALRNCSLNTRELAPDIIILYEAAFEGKFKMCKEVLFMMKGSKASGNSRERTIKVLSDLTGKIEVGKKNTFLLKASFIRAAAMIPFRKHYPIGIIKRIWLSINTFAAVMLVFFIEPMLNSMVKKILPRKYYLKLKSAYKK